MSQAVTPRMNTRDERARGHAAPAPPGASGAGSARPRAASSPTAQGARRGSGRGRRSRGPSAPASARRPRMPCSPRVRLISSGGRPPSTDRTPSAAAVTPKPGAGRCAAGGDRDRRRAARYDVPEVASRSSTVPEASIRPLPMIVAEVHTCCTSARMWELRSTVTPLAPRSWMVVADLADAGRVEPVGGLVEDQQLGFLQQGRGDREPLLHAEGVGLVAVAVPPGQAHRLERPVDAAGAGADGAGQQGEVLAAR